MDGSAPSSGSVSMGGKCYSKDDFGRNYTEAKTHCRRVGMQLARFDGQEDYEAVQNMIGGCYRVLIPLIGESDTRTGTVELKYVQHVPQRIRLR